MVAWRYRRPCPPKPSGNPRSEIKGEVGAAGRRTFAEGVARWLRRAQSNIHIDFIAVQLHQVAPRLRFALAHQLGQ